MLNPEIEFVGRIKKYFVNALNREVKFYYNYDDVELTPITAPKLAYVALVREWVDDVFFKAINMIDDELLELAYRADVALSIVRSLIRIVSMDYDYLFRDECNIMFYKDKHDNIIIKPIKKVGIEQNESEGGKK